MNLLILNVVVLTCNKKNIIFAQNLLAMEDKSLLKKILIVVGVIIGIKLILVVLYFVFMFVFMFDFLDVIRSIGH